MTYEVRYRVQTLENIFPGQRGLGNGVSLK